MEFYSGFIAVFVSGFCNKDEYVSSGVDSLERPNHNKQSGSDVG